MDKKSCMILSIFVACLMLCSCSGKENASEASSNEETGGTVRIIESSLSKEATEGDAVGAQHTIIMDNGDKVELSIRSGWKCDDAGSGDLRVSSDSGYEAVYHDSGITVGDVDSLEKVMDDELNISKSDTGIIDVDGKTCYAGYRRSDGGTQLVYLFQDVGCKDYMRIDITDHSGESVESAMSEFAIY